jgi:hypothetical protein
VPEPTTGTRPKRPNTPLEGLNAINEYHKKHILKLDGKKRVIHRKKEDADNTWITDYVYIKYDSIMNYESVAEELGRGCTPSSVSRLLRQMYGEHKLIHQLVNPRPAPARKTFIYPNASPPEEQEPTNPGKMIEIPGDVMAVFDALAKLCKVMSDQLDRIEKRLDVVTGVIDTYTAPTVQ